MGIYAYCLGPADHPDPPPLTGVDDATVTATRLEGFCLWTSALPRPPAPTLAAVRLHNAVIEAATHTRTPLPFRFGQWFADLDRLHDSIRDRADSLARQLEHVAGTVEFGLRLIDPEHAPDHPDRASGTAYLESLARRARADQVAGVRGRDDAAALRARLGPLVRDERVRPVGGGVLASIAHLVDRHESGSYTRTIDAFRRERPDLTLILTGPWPPYGFMD